MNDDPSPGRLTTTRLTLGPLAAFGPSAFACPALPAVPETLGPSAPAETGAADVKASQVSTAGVSGILKIDWV